MSKLIDHISRKFIPLIPPPCAAERQNARWLRRHGAALVGDVGTPFLAIKGLPQTLASSHRASTDGCSCNSPSLVPRRSLGSTLAVIGTVPDHFAETVTLARNSQHSGQRASESQFRATRMLQDAAGVANCNTYNRNQPARELRKGLFFRGRRRGAGIDSTSESFRTAFQIIKRFTT